MRKILSGGIIFIAGAACAVIMMHSSFALGASSSSEGDIMPKLNDIAKTQTEILTAVNAVKEEVQIIKLRITQNQ